MITRRLATERLFVSELAFVWRGIYFFLKEDTSGVLVVDFVLKILPPGPPLLLFSPDEIPI